MNAAQRCTLQTVYRSLNRDATSEMTLVHVHPQSMMHYVAPPEYCVYQELVVTSKPFMRDVVEVDGKWLEEYGRRGKEQVSVAQLFALCGRSVPRERQPPSHESKDKGDAAESARAALKKKEVDADAISAARARYLARKKQSGA